MITAPIMKELKGSIFTDLTIAVESRHAENVSAKSSKSQVLIYWAGKDESADVYEPGTSELVIQHLILFAIVENAH